MNYEEVLADLFECEIKSIVEADEIDEDKESDALLAREAVRPLLAELEDEPLYVAETDGAHIIAGARQAFLIGPDGTYAKSLDGSEEEVEEDEDLDEKCKTKSGKKAKKKMKKAEYDEFPAEDRLTIEDENYLRLETGDLLLVEVGQEHSCHGCSKFASNFPSCADSVAVGKKHGGDTLDQWLKDSMKTNTCSFFKGLSESLTEEEIAASPPVAEGLSVDYGSVVIRLNKYDLIKHPMREPGEQDKSYSAEAQEASEDALIMAAIAAKPAFMKAVRENLKANTTLSKYGLTIRESEDMAALETALVEEVTGRIAAGGGSHAVPKSVIDEMNWFDKAHKELNYETAVEHARNIIEGLELDESLIPIPAIGKNPQTPFDTGPGTKGRKGKSASGPKLDSVEDDDETVVTEDWLEAIIAFSEIEEEEFGDEDLDEQATTQIKATHPGITKLPEGAWNEWPVAKLVKHFAKLADKVGKPETMRAIMNIERWNKKQNPTLSEKARSVIDKLKKSKAYAKTIESIEEARGMGRGMGGPRQGDGGTDTCVCPSCGAKVPHERGTPCMETTCPKCGAKMVGESEEGTPSDFSPSGLGEAVPGKARYWVYKFDAAENKGVRVGADNNLKNALSELKSKGGAGGWVFDRQTKQKLGPKGNVIEALQKFTMKPCPVCGSKVPTNTGYCMKCKKKTLKEDDLDEQTTIYSKINPTDNTKNTAGMLGGMVEWDLDPAISAGPVMLKAAKASSSLVNAAEKLGKKHNGGNPTADVLKRYPALVKKLKAICRKRTPIEAAALWLQFMEDVNAHKEMAAIETALTPLFKAELGEGLDEIAGGLTMTMDGREIKEPTFLKSMAKKAGVTLKRALHLWGRAQFAAEEQYPEIKKKSSRYYEVVTGILKKMLRLKEDVDLKAWLAGLKDSDWKDIIEQNGEEPEEPEEPEDEEPEDDDEEEEDEEDEPKAKPKPKTAVAAVAAKKSKSAVNYQPQSETKKCKTCGFWLGGECSEVKGDIKADGTCDLYQKRVKAEGKDNLSMRISVDEADRAAIKKLLGIGLTYDTPARVLDGKLVVDVPAEVGRRLKPFMESDTVSVEVLQE
jgi:hypothetical protein